MVELARRHQLALVVDEVFLDYAPGTLPSVTPAGEAHRRGPVSSLAGAEGALCFALGGLSKGCALPQHKLAWIVVSGPEALVRQAEARMEVLFDAYLSVASPVQCALPGLFEIGTALREQVAGRVRTNRARLAERLAGTPVDLIGGEGTWSAMLQLPRSRSDEEWALALLEAGLVVQPGYFFDDDAPSRVVISMLPDPGVFAAAIERLVACVGAETEG
jgi:aspartate/methionine/tyrosine aminotransferase